MSRATRLNSGVRQADAAATFAGFDRASQQHIATANSLALRHAKLALGGRDTAPFDMLMIGDSITSGYKVSALAKRWPDVLRDTLRSKFPTNGVAGGYGYLSAKPYANSTGTFSDNPLTTSGGTQATTPAFGLDLQARVLSASGNTVTWTFTGTGFDIDYTTYSGGGSFSWAVDGGTATTVSTNAGSAIDTGSHTAQIRGLTAGSHSLVISWVSGSSYINGGFAYNGDENAGIRSSVMAYLGWTSANWWPTDSTKRYWTASIAKRSPDLVFIGLGANDFGSTAAAGSDGGPRTPAAYTSNIQAMIAAIKANVSGYVPSFVLLPYWTIGTSITPLAPYQDYVTAQYNIAAADPDGAVAVFDLQRRVNMGAAGTADGFLPDSTHPTDGGNKAVAEMIAHWLTTA